MLTFANNGVFKAMKPSVLIPVLKDTMTMLMGVGAWSPSVYHSKL
jgi:hypothetical protein